MYSQIPGGPPLDPHALHVANDELRHELVEDPRVEKILKHEPYTPAELFARNPPVVDPPASSAYRPPVSKAARKRRQKKGVGHLEIPECDLTVTLIILSFIPAVIGIILESIAYNQDHMWGEMIDDGDPFPKMPESGLDYFDDKKFVIDTSTVRLAEVRALIKRESIMEACAIGFVVLGVAVVLLALIMYSEGEAYKRTVVFCHFPAGFLALVAAVMILLSDDEIDGNHMKAAKILELFFQDIMDYRNVDDYRHLHLETVEEIGVQTLNLIAIQKTCALGSTTDGRMSGSSSTHFMYLLLDKQRIQKITLSQLRDLRFCSLEMYKHAAAALMLLYFIMCYVIPAIFYCQTHWAVVEPLDEDYDVDTDNEGDNTWKTVQPPPPPAYGYGSGGSGQEGNGDLVKVPAVHEHFEPRGLDDLLEEDFEQLALLHKQAMHQAGEKNQNNALEVGSNQSTMFINPSRPTSSRGRGDSPSKGSDLQRIAVLESKVQELSKKIDQVEASSRPNSGKSNKRG